MSIQVTPQEHDELDKLDDQTKAAAMSHLEKSGAAFSGQSGDDRKQMMDDAIEAAKAEVASQIDNADRAGMELLATADGSFNLGGMKIRPMSLGVLAILERINHPLMSGVENMSFDDLSILMYILAGDDLAAIVQASFAGADAIRAGATIWAMSIDVQSMRTMEAALQPMLDAAMDWGEAEDEGNENPTNPV